MGRKLLSREARSGTPPLWHFRPPGPHLGSHDRPGYATRAAAGPAPGVSGGDAHRAGDARRDRRAPRRRQERSRSAPGVTSSSPSDPRVRRLFRLHGSFAPGGGDGGHREGLGRLARRPGSGACSAGPVVRGAARRAAWPGPSPHAGGGRPSRHIASPTRRLDPPPPPPPRETPPPRRTPPPRENRAPRHPGAPPATRPPARPSPPPPPPP